MKKSLNLLYDPWIKVRCLDDSVKLVSIGEAIEEAQNIRRVEGEAETQDFAILRLINVFVHRVMRDHAATGEKQELEDENEALERWISLFEQGSFPKAPFENYFQEVKNKFSLFDEDCPALQRAHMEKEVSRAFEVKKLVGTLSISDHKNRRYQQKAYHDENGKILTELSPEEAARWLVHIKQFDDSGVKPSLDFKAKKKAKNIGGMEVAPGVAWLGKINVLYPEGETLFQTLMFNFVLLDDNDRLWSSEDAPFWEKDEREFHERLLDPQPKGPMELFTYPSRHVLLKHEDDTVTGVYIKSGTSFQKENCFVEQNSIWYKKGDQYIPLPKSSSRPYRQLWRNLSMLSTESDNCENRSLRRPGVLRWLSKVSSFLPEDQVITIKSPNIIYKDGQPSKIMSISFKTLHMKRNLLSKAGEAWRKTITEEVGHLEMLARDLQKIADIKTPPDKKRKYCKVEEDVYADLDQDFTLWISTLSAEDTPEEMIHKKACWSQYARKYFYKKLYEITSDFNLSQMREAFDTRSVFIRSVESWFKKDSKEKFEDLLSEEMTGNVSLRYKGTNTLLLRLDAPIQSYSLESTSLEERKTERIPTKSAVIGLIGAAMGRSRSDSLEDLYSLEMGVRVDKPGERLEDYHTRSARNKDDAYVNIKEYLQDAKFMVAVSSVSKELIDQIEQALKNPYYLLYLGRRSCPLTSPVLAGRREKTVPDALLEEPSLTGKGLSEAKFYLEGEGGVNYEIRDEAKGLKENRRYLSRSITMLSRRDLAEKDPFEFAKG